MKNAFWAWMIAAALLPACGDDGGGGSIPFFTDTDSDTDGDSDTDSCSGMEAGPEGALSWAVQASGTWDAGGWGIDAFPDGSFVVTGDFQGTVTFGPGEPNETTLTVYQDVHEYEDHSDAFVARYLEDGSLDWVVQVGGVGWDKGYAVAALADGSCAVTGYFEAVATFGTGQEDETTLTSAGGWDYFLAKWDAAGQLDWAVRGGGFGSPEVGLAIDVFDDGSLVTAGTFIGTATFGPGEPNETTFEPILDYALQEAFVAKHNPDGTLVWARRAYGPGDGYANGIAAAPDGAVLVTGHAHYGATFGAGEPTEEMTDGSMFLARYEADGSLGWAIGDGTWLASGEQVVALSDGSAAVVGRFEEKMILGEGETNETSFTCYGEEDAFLARYDGDGTLAWAVRVGGAGMDRALGLAATPDDTLLMTGYSSGFPVFDEGGSNETIFDKHGIRSPFFAGYDADGQLLWLRSAWSEPGGGAIGNAVAATGASAFLATGEFSDPTIFGPCEPNQTTLTPMGDGDGMFALRLAK